MPGFNLRLALVLRLQVPFVQKRWLSIEAISSGLEQTS